MYVWILQAAWMAGKYAGLKDWTADTNSSAQDNKTECYHTPDMVNTYMDALK